MVEIRKATLADEEDVAGLIRELGQTLGITGDVNPVSWYSTLRKMIASPEWSFLLAEDGAAKAGLLILLILPSLYHGGNYAAITELIVAKNRNGPTGDIQLIFNAEQTTFREPYPHDE